MIFGAGRCEQKNDMDLRGESLKGKNALLGFGQYGEASRSW